MKKIYLSPERRPAPHGPYFGYPTLFEHDVTPPRMTCVPA